MMGVDIPHIKIDLDEIQSVDIREIVRHKLIQAYQAVNSPVLVEDVGVYYRALGGLPGPFIKWFVDYAGSEACCRMLDGFEDRSAEIRCMFGYYDGDRFEFFENITKGMISDTPRGEHGFGFDAFFIHEGSTITRGEMSQEENERSYAETMKPFSQVREFLKTL